MLHYCTKTIPLLVTCFFFLQVSAQKTLSFHLGYNSANTQVMDNWLILNYHDVGSGNMNGLSVNLQYRWYKYDRGFRTLTLHHFTGGERPVYIDVYNNNTFEYETRKTEFKMSYTTLHYDAAFAIFKSEIDDCFMPYIGGGYFIGFMKSNLGLRKIGLDFHEQYKWSFSSSDQ